MAPPPREKLNREGGPWPPLEGKWGGFFESILWKKAIFRAAFGRVNNFTQRLLYFFSENRRTTEETVNFLTKFLFSRRIGKTFFFFLTIMSKILFSLYLNKICASKLRKI